jgi:hypothetical protein
VVIQALFGGHQLVADAVGDGVADPAADFLADFLFDFIAALSEGGAGLARNNGHGRNRGQT